MKNQKKTGGASRHLSCLLGATVFLPLPGLFVIICTMKFVLVAIRFVVFIHRRAMKLDALGNRLLYGFARSQFFAVLGHAMLCEKLKLVCVSVKSLAGKHISQSKPHSFNYVIPCRILTVKRVESRLMPVLLEMDRGL
jgi:hypothetical protein